MAVTSEPMANMRFQPALCSSRALTRKSNDTPRSASPMSMMVAGRYSAVSTTPWALGKAISSTPMPSTSQVSLASQKGPMLETITSFSVSVAKGSRMPTPRS